MIHGLLKGMCSTLGQTLSCADEQNPHHKGKFLDNVKLIHIDGDGMIAEHEGQKYLLLLCIGCLESVLRQLLPADGLAL